MTIRALMAGVLALGCLMATAAQSQERVVTLGGGITEIVFALGEGARVVGDDESSVYPPQAAALPKVGYYRSVPVEGVLALRPDLVLASSQSGPPHALDRLRDLGVNIVTLPDEPTLASLEARIQGVAQALGVTEAGARLIEDLRRDAGQIQALPPTGLRAIFIMNRTGRSLGAGSETVADATLRLAGIENALAGQRGYQPLSAEGLVALAPNLIITTPSTLQAVGGAQALLATPGIASTPAAKAGSLLVIDDLLMLGFGPRLPQALRELRDGADAHRKGG